MSYITSQEQRKFDVIDVRYYKGSIATTGIQFLDGEAPHREHLDVHTVEQGVTRKFIERQPRLTAALLSLPEMAAFRSTEPTGEELSALGDISAADFFGIRESYRDAKATLDMVLKDHEDGSEIETQMNDWMTGVPPDASTFSASDRSELDKMYSRSVFVATASEFVPQAFEPQVPQAAGHIAVQTAA